MTQRADRLLRPLLIIFAILAPVWLVVLILSVGPSSQTTPVPLSPLRIPERCILSATQILSDTGLTAAAAFNPDGTLRITIPYDLAEGTPQDEGAQAIWTAFDAVAALPTPCPFRYLHVTVWSGDLRLDAYVTGDELNAWGKGELDDESFAGVVTYTQEIIPPPAP